MADQKFYTVGIAPELPEKEKILEAVVTPQPKPELEPKPNEAEIRAEFDRLVAQFCAESSIKHPEARKVLAEGLASAVLRHRILFDQIVRNEASSNVQRTYPAVLTQILRFAKALGVATPKSDAPPDFA